MPQVKGRNYMIFKTYAGVKVNLRLSQKAYQKLLNLVQEGFYLNVNDAIRDAINFFLACEPYRKRFVMKTIKDVVDYMKT